METSTRTEICTRCQAPMPGPRKRRGRCRKCLDKQLVQTRELREKAHKRVDIDVSWRGLLLTAYNRLSISALAIPFARDLGGEQLPPGVVPMLREVARLANHIADRLVADGMEEDPKCRHGNSQPCRECTSELWNN